MSSSLPNRKSPQKVVVIGAGPAGLTAAYELQKLDARTEIVVLEASGMVGGIARTESKNGNRFDIGGHRFFTKVPEVQAMWEEVLKDDFLIVPRLSRIYYRGKFYSYPLKPFNTLKNIGPIEALRIIVSYIKQKAHPLPAEDTFEQWVVNRFGRRLYEHFFKSYTKKVWGIDPSEIRADWAAQRIKSLSLSKAIWNAISGTTNAVSLIEKFHYPRLGPGMLWDKASDVVTERGGQVHLNSAASRIIRDGSKVTEVVFHRNGGADREIISSVSGNHFISTMALRDLIFAFDPQPPDNVLRAAEKLRYRDFLIVALTLKQADPFPDNWIYVHSPHVRVARIQNFGAWSKEMLASHDTASIGMEYFCNQDGDLWSMSDDQLCNLAVGELEALNLGEKHSLVDFAIIRQRKAYPVYDSYYRRAVDQIAAWLKTIENLQTVGRSALHRYNNQDHSMLTGMYAARNIFGSDYNVWDVNTERSYHEDFELDAEYNPNRRN